MGWHWYLEYEIKLSIAASVELPSVLDPMSYFASLMLQFDVSRAEMHKVSLFCPLLSNTITDTDRKTVQSHSAKWSLSKKTNVRTEPLKK